MITFGDTAENFIFCTAFFRRSASVVKFCITRMRPAEIYNRDVAVGCRHWRLRNLSAAARAWTDR